MVVVENTVAQSLIDALASSRHPVEKKRPLVTYAGVIGYTQDRRALVDVARSVPGSRRRGRWRPSPASMVPNVEITGHVKREQLREIYQRTDVLFGSMRERPTFNRATVRSKPSEYTAVANPLVFADAVAELGENGKAFVAPQRVGRR